MARPSPKTAGLLPLPSSRPALRAERVRLVRELGATSSARGRRLLSIELRRVSVALDGLEHEVSRLVSLVAPAPAAAVERRRPSPDAPSLSAELVELVRQPR